MNPESVPLYKLARNEYSSWSNMVSRCTSKTNPDYPRYSRNGITVCDRWRNFFYFLSDMGLKPTPKHSIDRIDNDKGYFPSNCRWATQTEQTRNTVANRMLTLNGVTHCIAEWSDLLDMPYSTIRGRLRCGWSEEKTLTHPRMKNQFG